jgi:hypothetical protein
MRVRALREGGHAVRLCGGGGRASPVPGLEDGGWA